MSDDWYGKWKLLRLCMVASQPGMDSIQPSVDFNLFVNPKAKHARALVSSSIKANENLNSTSIFSR
jgi:hypothetical protein